MRNVLNIAFSANDAHIKYLCVTAKSIFDNHDDSFNIVVNILTDRLSQSALALLSDTFAQAPASVSYKVHYVDDSSLKGLKVRQYTIYAWYRILLPELLPDVDKILYLDTDVAVNDTLAPLARFDMADYAIATAPDTDTFIDEPFRRCGYDKAKGYVCDGVMMMNLDVWRRRGLAADVVKWAHDNNDILKYPDQDSINYVCRDLKTYLPLRYGVTKSVFTEPWFYTRQYKHQLTECLENPAIVHYAGCAPWLRESDHPMVGIWLKYNNRLQKPVHRVYKTKGWLGIKLRIFDMLHPSHSRAAISIDRVKQKIDQIV